MPSTALQQQRKCVLTVRDDADVGLVEPRRESSKRIHCALLVAGWIVLVLSTGQHRTKELRATRNLL
ncbi:MAG TPA: hypothetical protein VF493_14845, partial [Terriglobales bacterium]